AVRPFVRVAQIAGSTLIFGTLGIRLVEQTGLGNADPDRRFVTIHVGQERDLQCQRVFREDPSGPFDAPKDQAPWERQPRQAAAKISFAHRCWESPKLTERHQVFHDLGGLVVTKQKRLRPRRQFAFAPKREIRLVFREDSKAESAQAIGVRDVFAVDRLQQPAEKANAEFRRRLDPGGGEETLPKYLSRPLLAVAQERPANAALVILSAR